MKKITLAILSCLPLLSPNLGAVSVSTAPVGFINLTIKGTDAGAGMTAISVPMLPQIVYSGVISGAAGNVITDSSGTWADGDYAMADPNGNASYYAEITSHTDASQVGTILEITGSSASAKTLTVGSDVTGLDGASYAIRKFRTISDVFGADNSANLGSGSSATASDVVYKVGIDAGKVAWQRYYYQNAPVFAGGNGWRKAGDSQTDMANVAIFPDEGLLVRRRAATDISITLPGSIKTHNSRTALVQGFNLVSLSYPVDVTLESLGLDSKVTAGSSPSNADVIYMVTGAGQFERYYYQNAPVFAGGDGWRKAGDNATDQKDATVPAGGAIIVLRRDSAGIDWSTNKPF
jgi:uncharacterized protein (TIGR02597 family)